MGVAVQFVELPAEQPLQFFCAAVAGVVVIERTKLFLKLQKTHDVLVDVAGEDEIVLEVGVNQRSVPGGEGSERRFELFGGVASNLREE